MSKAKYKYNPKILAYEEVRVHWTIKVLKISLLVAPSILIGLALSFLFTNRIQAPQTRSLKKEIVIMHPGPINRGVKITTEVADSAQSIILQQVENGVAVRMAVLYLLSQKRKLQFADA